MIKLYFSSINFQIIVFFSWLIFHVVVFMFSPLHNYFIRFLEKNNIINYKYLFSGFSFVIMFFFLFMPLINPVFFNQGYVNEFSEMSLSGNILCGIDYQYEGFADLAGYDYYHHRLHIIDLENGKQIFMKKIYKSFLEPYSNLIVAQNNDAVLLYDNKEMKVLDIHNKKIKFIISKDTLPNLIPILSKGVMGFKFYNKTYFITILTKDGHEYLVNPFNLEIMNKIPENYSNRFENKNNIININESAGRKFPLGLSGENRKKLLDSSGNVINENLVFLGGRFLQVFPSQKKIIISSYHTLEKKDFIITCVSFNGAKRWQKNEKEFNLNGFFKKNINLQYSGIYKENLILVIAGFVVSVKVEDGEINWKTRF